MHDRRCASIRKEKTPASCPWSQGPATGITRGNAQVVQHIVLENIETSYVPILSGTVTTLRPRAAASSSTEGAWETTTGLR